MKKNNAIVLSIIAVFALLVVIVGATYAYFTNQVSTKNDNQNTVEIKTAALASATMNMGSKITMNDVYPGAKAVKSVNVKGSCGNDATTCDPVGAVISVVANIDESVFKNDIEWALYKSDSEFTCRNVVTTTTGDSTTEGTSTTVVNQYKMVPTCKVGTVTDETTEEQFTALPDVNFDSMTKVLSSENSVTDADISVAGNTNDNYYLVVTYKDNGDQNAQQGKNFSVSINFAAKSLNN